MKREKVFEDEHIVIYAKKPEVGEEANAADSCIEAAIIFAVQFSEHLVASQDFLDNFRGLAYCALNMLENYTP